MPPGEEMFNYHGYSGPCPVAAPTPLGRDVRQPSVEELHAAHIASRDDTIARLLKRIVDLESDAATTGEPVAWMVEMANALAMAVRELSASRLRAHEPAFSTALGGVMAKADDLRTRGYSRPDPQLAALTEERDALKDDRAMVYGQLLQSREKVAALTASLETITERSSYPIDPRDAFEEAISRARRALPAEPPEVTDG